MLLTIEFFIVNSRRLKKKGKKEEEEEPFSKRMQLCQIKINLFYTKFDRICINSTIRTSTTDQVGFFLTG